jgi:hypothetical protein
MKKIDEQQIAELEALCRQIGEIDGEGETAIERALALSEGENTHPAVRSLAIDAMLVAEGDFTGEFHSTAELLSAVERLRGKN